MAVIDDYLEVRPERLSELRRAAAAGRITLGPWYTLPDEHLVSGEALIRNLELGLRRARELGRPLLAGYLPDQFGHTAQMPQILRRFGIDTAVLWRGVPAGIDSAVFRWEALDGSAVDALHMRFGYGHGKLIPLDPALLEERLQFEVDRQLPANPDGPWLVMNGDDHLPVPAGLATAVASSNLSRPAAISSVADYLAVRPPAVGLHRGELLSAHSSFVLKGTLSSRFPLKLRHAALERRLERYVEPAWALSGRDWPGAELAYAWRQLILGSAHDSICGCSIDQVHQQAGERLARAEAVAEELWTRLGSGPGCFNPSPFERLGIPGLAVGAPRRQARAEADVQALGILFEDIADSGDEYTHQPPAGAQAVRREPAPDEVRAWRLDAEPLAHLEVAIDNRATDHRLRLLVPAATAGGAWAGTAFGAVQRPFRSPGWEPGIEYDLRTDPARGWVSAGGMAVLLDGPFEYELLDGFIAVTLLRCTGWLSRDDLANRPGHAGPPRSTPDAQMIGRHSFRIGVLRHDGDWRLVPRWSDVFSHPLAPAPAARLRRGPEIEDALVILSALRGGPEGVRIRTYDLRTFSIDERLIEPADG